MSKRGSREGSIYKRESDGRWVGAVSLDRGDRKVVYGATRGEVAERMKALLKTQQDGVVLRSSDRLNVGAYLTKWIEGARASVRGSTFRRYEQLVRVHLIPRIGRIPLSKLAPSDLTAMYATMTSAGLAPRTAGHAYRVLGRALHDAEVSGVVARNVTRLVRPPRVPHAEMRTLTNEQARTLIDAVEADRLGTLYVVALASGARLGELLALRWQDVDLARSTIRITRSLTRTDKGFEVGETKTASSRRSIPLGRAAMASLAAHRLRQAEERLRNGLGKAAMHDLVFGDELGRPIDGTHIAQAFRRVLARAELPRIRFHDLRHTAATLLLEAGMHPRVVAEQLGHSTPSLVMNTYGHVTERMQTEATAVLDRVLGG